MKPREYIEEFNLDKKGWFNWDPVVKQMEKDFLASVAHYKMLNEWNFSNFKVCVKNIYEKFNAISNLRPKPLPEKMWNKFYATVVGPFKDREFGEYLREKEKRREEWDNPFIGGFSSFFDDFMRMAIGSLFTLKYPKNSFDLLNLDPEGCTVEEVKIRYRQLSLLHHPDMNGGDGSAETFIKITKAKDACIRWLEQHNARVEI